MREPKIILTMDEFTSIEAWLKDALYDLEYQNYVVAEARVERALNMLRGDYTREVLD